MPPPWTVRLGISRSDPEGVPLPPLGRGTGPPENPLFTDPGGAGTSRDLAGVSPAITSEVSVVIDVFAAKAGGSTVMVSVSPDVMEAAACRAGGTNFGCWCGSDTAAFKLPAGAATSGAAGRAGAAVGSVNLGFLGGVNGRTMRCAGRSGGLTSGTATAILGASVSVGVDAMGSATFSTGARNGSAGGRSGAIATMFGNASGLAGAISGAGVKINCGGWLVSLSLAAIFCSNFARARKGRASYFAAGGCTSGSRSLSLYQTMCFSNGCISRS